jgi:D-glutamate cyclase
MPKFVAENVDRLCSVEMRSLGLPRGLARAMYDIVLADAGEPLSYRAAQMLLQNTKSKKPFFITCNAGGPPWLPNGETDGPLGGVAIARALNIITGAVPIFVATDYHAQPIAAVARAAGLVVTDPETALYRSSWATTVVPYNEIGNGTQTAIELFDQYQPTAVIAIESLGPNPDGVIHSVTGHPIRDAPAYHSIFELAAKRQIPSLGIGDGGNEIGFGRVADEVRKIHPYGSKCQYPDGKGVVTTISTDLLVFSAVSNWGAYGVAAMISLLSGQLDALHDASTESRMLEACITAGAVDGGSANHGFTVDGIDGRVSCDLIYMLHTMIRLATQTTKRPF